MSEGFQSLMLSGGGSDDLFELCDVALVTAAVAGLCPPLFLPLAANMHLRAAHNPNTILNRRDVKTISSSIHQL